MPNSSSLGFFDKLEIFRLRSHSFKSLPEDLFSRLLCLEKSIYPAGFKPAKLWVSTILKPSIIKDNFINCIDIAYRRFSTTIYGMQNERASILLYKDVYITLMKQLMSVIIYFLINRFSVSNRATLLREFILLFKPHHILFLSLVLPACHYFFQLVSIRKCDVAKSLDHFIPFPLVYYCP